jgi:hypothetical protein
MSATFLSACRSSMVARSSGAPSTSSVTSIPATPTNWLRSAHAYAQQILDSAPLPRRAHAVPELPDSIVDAISLPSLNDEISIHRNFLLSSTIDISNFVREHDLRGASLTGTQSDGGSNMTPAIGDGMELALTNRHVSFAEIDYSTGNDSASQLELRVDVHVVWLPVRTVVLPESNTVTLTGFGALSLMNLSSDPTTIELTTGQIGRLRSALSALHNTAGSGGCMENDTLFAITARSGSTSGSPWRAVAEECPDYVTISSGALPTLQLLDSCTFERLISSFFPPKSAVGTRRFIQSCSPDVE